LCFHRVSVESSRSKGTTISGRKAIRETTHAIDAAREVYGKLLDYTYSGRNPAREIWVEQADRIIRDNLAKAGCGIEEIADPGVYRICLSDALVVSARNLIDRIPATNTVVDNDLINMFEGACVKLKRASEILGVERGFAALDPAGKEKAERIEWIVASHKSEIREQRRVITHETMNSYKPTQEPVVSETRAAARALPEASGEHMTPQNGDAGFVVKRLAARPAAKRPTVEANIAGNEQGASMPASDVLQQKRPRPSSGYGHRLTLNP
jgi:hypothetical protein